MQKFTIKKEKEIKAPKNRVWQVLLTPEFFTEWGTAFCPDSKMKGDWKLGGSITYLDGNGMGLQGKVIEFDPNNRVTVEYDATLLNGNATKEDEQGWIGCKETYILSDVNGGTHLKVESEVPTVEFYEELGSGWDRALQQIKVLAEK